MSISKVAPLVALSCLPVLLLLPLLVPKPGDAHEAEPALPDEVAASPSAVETAYYIVTREDTRECAFPQCGGWFVRAVNLSVTRCADGQFSGECYVAMIDVSGLGLPDEDAAEFREAVLDRRALVRATLRRSGLADGPEIGAMVADEGWIGRAGSQPQGQFVSMKDNGIQCVTFPCPTLHVASLNGEWEADVAGVDLSGAGAAKKWQDLAHSALQNGALMLAAGTFGVLRACRRGRDDRGRGQGRGRERRRRVPVRRGRVLRPGAGDLRRRGAQRDVRRDAGAVPAQLPAGVRLRRGDVPQRLQPPRGGGAAGPRRGVLIGPVTSRRGSSTRRS
jgi:hypothetical protein